MSTPTPIPTIAPSAHGLSSYLPMSSFTNPMAAGYQAPMSNVNSGQLNSAGQSYYAGNGSQTVAKTNTSTGAILGANTGPVPQPGPAPTTPQAPSGPSEQDQLNAQLDSIFSPVFSSLQGQQDTLNQKYQTEQQDLQQQYDTSKQSLAAQNTSGMQGLDTLGTQAGQTKTDAYTAATRLYNELNRGGQQRFGGASSAGEAYGALTAVEQQRRQASIQDSYDKSMQQVAQYKSDLISRFQDSVAQLESQKTSAFAAALQQFRDASQSIASAKNQAQSDKASATMSSLQDYRNKVYTINQQSLSFAQQLASNQQLSLKAVDDYIAKVQQSFSSGQIMVTNFANQAMNTAGATNLGISKTTTPTSPYVAGQIASPSKGYHVDPNTGQIVPDTQ